MLQVKREFCFNDWAEMDKDGNCKLDFLETLEKDSKTNPGTGKTDFDTLDSAWDLLNQKGFVGRLSIDSIESVDADRALLPGAQRDRRPGGAAQNERSADRAALDQPTGRIDR